MPSPIRTSFVIAALLIIRGPAYAWNAIAAPRAVPQEAQQSSEMNGTAADFDAARRLAQQGKYDEAIAALRELAANHSETKGLAHEFGLIYYKKNDFVDAITYLKKARDENPDDGEAVQLLGLSYYLSGHPADAIAPLEKVQTWFPSANVDAAYVLGICYIQTKDYPHARGAFAKMFGVSPDSAASYLFAARMLLRQDFGPVAEEYAQKAVSLDPQLPLAHFLLGELDLYHSKIPEAVTEFERELQLNPGYAAAYYKQIG